MPRTAPTVDGSGNVRNLTLHCVDNSGDIKSEAFEIGITDTAAEIEAFVAGYAARTNSNVYQVDDSMTYSSPARASDALNAVGKSNSVADGINFLFVSNTRESEDIRLMAPVATMCIGTTDAVDPVEAAAFVALAEPLMTGSKVGLTAQYTERKEKKNNPKLRL